MASSGHWPGSEPKRCPRSTPFGGPPPTPASLSPGEAYLPFAEMPELRNAVLTGRPEDNSAYQALLARGLAAPSGSRPLPLPPSGSPRRILDKDDKKA